MSFYDDFKSVFDEIAITQTKERYTFPQKLTRVTSERLSFREDFNNFTNSLFVSEGITDNNAFRISSGQWNDYEHKDIDTIIFDLGSVLFGYHNRAVVRAKIHEITKLPDDVIKELLSEWFEPSKKDFPALGDDEQTDINTIIERFRLRIPEQYQIYANTIVTSVLNDVRVFDYTIPMLQELHKKGYRVYYLSNWSKSSFELMDCHNHEVHHTMTEFDGGIISYQVGCKKPNPEIYQLLLKRGTISIQRKPYSLMINLKMYMQQFVRELMDVILLSISFHE